MTGASFNVLHVTIVVASSRRLIQILMLSQNWIEVGICGNHVLPHSMDAFTSCQAKLGTSNREVGFE